jgi:hypothetical protein
MLSLTAPDGPFAENEVRAIAGACLDEDMMPVCP